MSFFGYHNSYLDTMKLSAVVVSFFYSNEKLYSNVINYINDVDLLIIWDNTPLENRAITESFWSGKSKKVVLLGTGKNEGIGYALNKAAELSISYGCMYMMTMDQDSIWRDFQSYKMEIENCQNPSIAIYAPTIANIKGDLIYTCNKEDLYAITSGSIIDLHALKSIGLFNEKFFIDEVDNEFCIRTVKKGYHIHIINNAFLYQQFGPDTVKQGLSQYKNNYSAFRTYYQIRNRLWMHRMYPKELNWRYKARTFILCILRRLFLIICFENDKKKKLLSMFKGLWDGYKLKP